MTRSGLPIREHPIKDSVNPNINFSMSYAVWDAAIAAGASLDELEALDSGRYKPEFAAKLIAWHNMNNLIQNHAEDAMNRKVK